MKRGTRKNPRCRTCGGERDRPMKVYRAVTSWEFDWVICDKPWHRGRRK